MHRKCSAAQRGCSISQQHYPRKNNMLLGCLLCLHVQHGLRPALRSTAQQPTIFHDAHKGGQKYVLCCLTILHLRPSARHLRTGLDVFILDHRFAELLVDAGGVQQLLRMPQNKHTFAGLSFAFFGLSVIPLAFERVVSNCTCTHC